MNFKEEMCKECNTQASKGAMLAINASFLLNGSAATAMFAQKIIGAATMFGLGAFLAIICNGLAYLTMLGIAESWKPDEYQKIEYKVFFGKISIGAKNCEKYRERCFYLWCLSLFLFVAGVIAVNIA